MKIEEQRNKEAIQMNVQEEIRKLAYDFYEKNGRTGGRELEHWLKAEQIVMTKLAARRTAGSAEPESEKPQKTAPPAGGGTKPKRTQPAAHERVETGEPETEKRQKTAPSAGGSTKPKRTQKKRSETKAGEKKKKPKG
ncbi:MAG: DUF2934 domain-containing protein [Candidatus Sulfobium sp.]|jgi:hypothetical protein